MKSQVKKKKNQVYLKDIFESFINFHDLNGNLIQEEDIKWRRHSGCAFKTYVVHDTKLFYVRLDDLIFVYDIIEK
jgi:hypothetical protein